MQAGDYLARQHITKTRECKFETKGCKIPCRASSWCPWVWDRVLSDISYTLTPPVHSEKELWVLSETPISLADTQNCTVWGHTQRKYKLCCHSL